MTRVEAAKKAKMLFPGFEAHALLRRKSAANRYVICRYVLRPHPQRGVDMIVLGEGTSWEAAFTDADLRAGVRGR